jgi:hypothetical protein
MFELVTQLFAVALHAFLSFFFTNFIFFYTQSKFTKSVSMIINYAAMFIINSLIYYMYFKTNHNRSMSAFSVMASSMIFYFVFQTLIYKFLYKGSLDFLNFEEYLVPTFIMASVIFLIGTFVK